MTDLVRALLNDPTAERVDAGVIGYYVHHHGTGHRSRFEKIRTHTSSPLVPISELDFDGGVSLVSDVPDAEEDPTAGGALHWAPVGDSRAAGRAKQIVDWVAEVRPAGAVVDVSVEAALLFRLVGVPTIVVRQHGERTDRAHELAYRSAQRLLAPYPSELEHPATPAWVVDKTVHCGFIMDDRPHIPSDDVVPESIDVVVLWGSGGGELSSRDLAALAHAAQPGHLWLAGHIAAARTVNEPNVVVCRWVDDIQRFLRRRPVVVASAGNNTVADVAQSGSALVVVPQDRPFGEQHRHAQSLDAACVASTVGRAARGDEWGRAIAEARLRRPALSRLARLDGAEVAAAVIDECFG